MPESAIYQKIWLEEIASRSSPKPPPFTPNPPKLPQTLHIPPPPHPTRNRGFPVLPSDRSRPRHTIVATSCKIAKSVEKRRAPSREMEARASPPSLARGAARASPPQPARAATATKGAPSVPGRRTRAPGINIEICVFSLLEKSCVAVPRYVATSRGPAFLWGFFRLTRRCHG